MTDMFKGGYKVHSAWVTFSQSYTTAHMPATPLYGQQIYGQADVSRPTEHYRGVCT